MPYWVIYDHAKFAPFREMVFTFLINTTPFQIFYRFISFELNVSFDLIIRRKCFICFYFWIIMTLIRKKWKIMLKMRRVRSFHWRPNIWKYFKILFFGKNYKTWNLGHFLVEFNYKWVENKLIENLDEKHSSKTLLWTFQLSFTEFSSKGRIK